MVQGLFTEVSKGDFASGRVAIGCFYYARHVVILEFQFAAHFPNFVTESAIKLQSVLRVLLRKKREQLLNSIFTMSTLNFTRKRLFRRRYIGES